MTYTQAQIDKANAVDLEKFLRAQGETLVRSGKEYRWKAHDSLTVCGNKWFRHSQSKGGHPVDFVMEFYGKSFPEAVQMLTGEPGEVQPETDPAPSPAFRLPLRNVTNANILNYALMKNKIIGVCPNCGANVVEREKGWFCESNPCRFVLWKDNAFFKRLGKRLDAHVADKLLRDGRVRLKDCKSAKGKTYNATVLLSCEADGRSKFSLEFEGGC